MHSRTITVPILPLPDTVFFPHTLLPLHIFEPRYKQMIKDVLDSNGMVGVVQLRPGWHESYFESPPVYKVLGVGSIIESEQLEDGRYDILLSGRYRTQIVAEQETAIYRSAEVHIVEDEIQPADADNVSTDHETLLTLYAKISAALPSGTSLHPGLDEKTVPPGTLVDVMSSLLVNDPYERQSLLSEPDVARRQQLLRVQIRSMFNPTSIIEDPE